MSISEILTGVIRLTIFGRGKAIVTRGVKFTHECSIYSPNKLSIEFTSLNNLFTKKDINKKFLISATYPPNSKGKYSSQSFENLKLVSLEENYNEWYEKKTPTYTCIFEGDDYLG